MITESDREAATAWTNAGVFTVKQIPTDIAYESFLAGVKHERKRQGDKCREILKNDLPNELERMIQHEMANMTVGFPKAVIHFTDGDLELPIEQVGEKHWRIKE
jgi:hypothetical protein